MKQFTIIYIYPDDDRVASCIVKAKTMQQAFLYAATELVKAGREEVSIVCAIPGAAINYKWDAPACDGWKLCNVGDYLKSMEVDNETN